MLRSGPFYCEEMKARCSFKRLLYPDACDHNHSLAHITPFCSSEFLSVFFAEHLFNNLIKTPPVIIFVFGLFVQAAVAMWHKLLWPGKLSEILNFVRHFICKHAQLFRRQTQSLQLVVETQWFSYSIQIFWSTK